MPTSNFNPDSGQVDTPHQPGPNDPASGAYGIAEMDDQFAVDITAAEQGAITVLGRLQSAAWKASTQVGKGQRGVGSNGTQLECTTAGTTGATEPTWGTTVGGTVTDGTVTWTVRGLPNGAYAPAALPSALSTAHVQRFTPRGSIYNAKGSNTLRLRAQLAKAKAGVDYARIALVGDSTTAGYKILPTSASTFPVVLRGLLSTAGLPIAGTGPVVANPDGSAGSVIDGRWSFAGGTWTSQSNNVNHLKQAPAAAAVATFTSDLAGTVIEIAYLDSGDGFTYSIDGAAYVAGPAIGNTGTMKSLVLTGQTNATHTVALKANGVNFWAIWVDVRQATSGVLLGNFGLDGSRVVDWNNTTAYFAGPLVNTWAPHCTFVNLSINDAGGSTAISTYQSTLQAIITRHLGSGDVILVNAVPTQGVDKTAYREAQYALADSNGIALLDIDDRWGHGFEPMNTYGMYASGDSTHPSPGGAADIALAHLPLFID